MDRKLAALAFPLCSLAIYAQIVSPIFFQSSSVAACSLSYTTNLKGWYSADCMTAVSPCATSYADGHSFTTNQTWLDRSSNSNTLTIDELQCVFKLNKINGLPAVSFGGPDGSGNCGWLATSQWDSSATSWAVFVAFRSDTTSAPGIIVGPSEVGTTNPGTFRIDNDNGDLCAKYISLVKAGTALVGCDNTTSNTTWHQLSVQFSNQSDQNTLTFRIDRSADGPTSFTSTNINTNNGGAREIGVERRVSYDNALIGEIAEIILYSGTGNIMGASGVSNVETYLNCRYGL